jgi:hypothetical protein
VSEDAFVAVPISVELEAILQADSALERARARRVKLAHLLAALGVPLWLATGQIRSLAAAAFAVGLAAVVWSLGDEWRCGVRRSRRIAALPGGTCAGPANEQS